MQRWKFMRNLTTIFVVLLLLGSCTSAPRKAKEFDTVGTRVKVENRNVMSMNIYVLKRSQRVRLGLVAGLTTRVLAIPNDLIVGAHSSLRLLADPVGSGRTPISEEFTVSPGDLIEMVIRSF
jgi:hypothetical protein